MADKQNTHYISAKESRDIARSNRREIRRLQKLRKTYRRADCVTQMKDPRNMINAAANNTALVYYPNLWIAPGICIVLAVLAFNFVGDGLRDAFDPKARR